jgi:outer membrane protein assembly factor BamB
VTALGDEGIFSGSRAASFNRGQGAVRWTFDLPGDGSGGENQVSDVAVDRHGDLVLVGRDHGREDEFFQGYFTVIELDGETGDVFVSGSGENLRPFLLIKLSGDDGRVLWGSETPAYTLVTDARGDVIAASDVVVKVDGATGNELWRTSSFYDVVGRVRGRNVVATTCTGEDGHVVVLDGADGAELWRRSFPTGRYCPLRAAVLRDRDVVISAVIGSDVDVARLDGRSGDTKWQRRLPRRDSFPSVSHLAVGRSDIVVHSRQAFIRLSPAGEETFRFRVPGWTRGGVVVSPRGTVVVAGEADLDDGTPGVAVRTFPRRILRGSWSSP